MNGKSLILGRNILVNFASQFIIFLTAFFTTPFILKSLGQTNYSLLILLTTVVAFFIALDFGFSPAFIQAFSENLGAGRDWRKLFWTGLFFSLLISGLWALSIFFLAPFLLKTFFPIVQQVGPMAITDLRIFALILFLSSLGAFFTISFQAQQKFHLAALRQILLGTIIPVGSVFLLKQGQGLREIIYLHLTTHFCVGVLLLYLLRQSLALKMAPAWSGQALRRLFAFAKWKFIGQIAGQIREKASRFFLTFYLSLGNLAFFVIPQNLVGRYISLLPNITTPIFTMTAKLTGEEGEEALFKLYRHSVKIINIILLPIGVFLFLFGQDFLKLWIGIEFAQETGKILKILVIAYSLAILNGLPVVFLEGKGKPGLPAGISVLIVILFLLFSIILIPNLGLIGAALVALLAYLIEVPIFIMLATKKILGKLERGFFLGSYFYPILLAMVTGLLFSLLKREIKSWFSFGGHLVGFLAFYIFLIFVFKLISKEERRFLKNLWKFLQLS